MDGVIENLIAQEIKTYALKALFAAVPFLAVPPLSWVVGPIAGFIIDKVLAIAQQIIAFEIIDFKTELEQAAYVEAVKKVLAAQTSTDPQVINEAKAAFSSALGPLISFQ